VASGQATIEQARARYTRLRARFSASTAGAVHQRITQLEVMNKALILAALGFMLFIPALLTLSAVLPLGREHGLAASWARHLGLSARAAHDVRRLFASTGTTSSSTTILSALFTVVFAYGWPAELQRGYELIWQLSPRPLRQVWRPILWLLVFFVVIVLIAASGTVASGVVGGLFIGLVCSPVTFGWMLWSQRLLLGGRVAYRKLVPGAFVTSLALLGFSLVMPLYLSRNIVSNYDRYGPIGVIFALLSWMLYFSAVMLGGPLAGHTIYLRRHPPDGGGGVDPVVDDEASNQQVLEGTVAAAHGNPEEAQRQQDAGKRAEGGPAQPQARALAVDDPQAEDVVAVRPAGRRPRPGEIPRQHETGDDDHQRERGRRK